MRLSRTATMLMGVMAASYVGCNSMDPNGGAPSDDTESVETEATAGEAKVALGGSAVTASTNDGNVPANVVDGSLLTRWSASGDGQWLRFDLGTTRRVTQLRAAPYNGLNRQMIFDIQTSTNGSTWVTAAAGRRTALNNNLQTFDFPDVDVRFVRIFGHMNTVSSWNAFTEVEIWAVASTGGGTGGTGGTGTGGTGGSKFSIGGAAVTASSNDGNVPANVVDGNLATRWSASGDGQWIRFDLGATRRVMRIRAAPYNGTLRQFIFDIQTSANGSTWVDAATGVRTALNSTLQGFEFPDVDARFVRLVGHGNTVSAWNSWTEVEIYGTNSSGGICTPESNTIFCERLGKKCGSFSGTDNCGKARTVSSCGSCTSPATCGGGGTANVCGTSSSGGLVWRKANLTWFTSFPDPGSEECIEFNGCTWAGQFAFVSGTQTKSWVMSHNIIAVHSKDAGAFKLKTLRLKQGTKQIDAKVYDMCADSDCSGCCTANATRNGLNFLIDLESFTADRFGTRSGIVDWACLDCN